MQNIYENKINVENIYLSQVDSTRKIDENLELKCKNKWQETLEKAKNNNSKIWDSKIYRFESILSENNKLNLIAQIDFSVRLSMNAFTEDLQRLGEEYFAMGMFFSVFIKTSDNYFIFVNKSKVLSGNKMPLMGGVFSQSEYDLNNQNILPIIQNEIEEEVGILFASKEIDLINIYRTDNFNCCLLFLVNSTFDKSYFEKNFKSEDGEIANLIFVHKDDLENFVDTIEQKERIKFEILKEYI